MRPAQLSSTGPAAGAAGTSFKASAILPAAADDAAFCSTVNSICASSPASVGAFLPTNLPATSLMTPQMPNGAKRMIRMTMRPVMSTCSSG